MYNFRNKENKIINEMVQAKKCTSEMLFMQINDLSRN